MASLCVLAALTNEDIVSDLISQKDIFPVLDGILGIIEKKSTRTTPTASFPRNDISNPPPVKRRNLYRVPADANDWDVPYSFQQGDGPDEYHKTWERKRTKDLVVLFIKLIKLSARKAPHHHNRAEFYSIISSPQTTTPGLSGSTFTDTMDNNSDSSERSFFLYSSK